jgi:phosphoenolpyruvate carboxykinase (GTP)
MFGIAPAYGEITWTGLDFSAEQFKSVTSIDKAAWQAEFKLHDEHFAQLAFHLPKALLDTKSAMQARLGA